LIRAYAVHRRVENDYLVRQRGWRLVRDLLAVAAGVAALGGGLWVFIWVHTEITDIGYAVDRLERQLHGLQQEERRLRLEAAYLTHPARVERLARQELGLQAPSLEQTVFWEEWVP